MGYFSCRRETAVLTPTTSNPQPRIFRKEEVESATSSFSSFSFLGRGSHGSVFLAALDGGGLIAAVKIPAAAAILTVENEIDVLTSLPLRSRRRIVNLIGHTRDSPRIAVVEFMPGGSLHDLLHSALHPPTWRRRVRLALQVAEAVASLHALRPQVVHRDIKPSNVLIDRDGCARLADFGLAVRLTAPTTATTPPVGTMGAEVSLPSNSLQPNYFPIRYIDPNYVTPGNLSTKTDVYSFGVLVLEIVSGRKPIDLDYSPSSLVDWAASLVELDELWDPRVGPTAVEGPAARELAEMALKCVAPLPEDRPCMADVVGRLRSIGRTIRSTPLVTWARVGAASSARNRKVSDVAA